MALRKFEKKDEPSKSKVSKITKISKFSKVSDAHWDPSVSRKKIILSGFFMGAILAICGVGWFYYTDNSKNEIKNPDAQESKVDQPISAPTQTAEQPKIEAPSGPIVQIQPEKPIVKTKTKQIHKVKTAKTLPKRSVNTENMQLAGSGTYEYNLLAGGGPLIVVPPKAEIEVSRDPQFKNLYVTGFADNNGEFRITTPPPGNVYWRVKDSSAMHKIVVSEPLTAVIKTEFQKNMTLNDTLSWTSEGNTNSYYKLEVASDGNFQNTTKVFTTKETSVPASNIGKGNWYVRVSAFNLQSGTWDMDRTQSVTID